jgi:hypothetical protein
MNDERVPHPMHAPQRCEWNSNNESRPLALRHKKTLGKAVRNGARRINASTI